jgi:hypothetical protein
MTITDRLEASCADDEAIHAAARARLRSSGYPALGGIGCQVRDRVVILSGVVPTFYLKQLAQTFLLRLDRVRGVRNLVEVAVPAPRLLPAGDPVEGG